MEYKLAGDVWNYRRVDDTNPYYTAEYKIEDKWTDDVGDVWYKIVWIDTTVALRAYVLCKITDNGRTIELCMYTGHQPTEIHPTSPLYTYWIYYRQ